MRCIQVSYVKKTLFLLISILMLFVLCSCDDNDTQEVKSIINENINETQVESIKSIILDGGYVLGDLIEAGLASPTYNLYDPAEDGNTYVTIKGAVNYAGQDVIVGLQYKQISIENEVAYYEFYTLVYNDVPQSLLEVNNFFEYLITSYETRKIEN